MSFMSFDEHEESKFLRKAKENPFVPVGEPLNSGHVLFNVTLERAGDQL